ncbi:hypothetical protein QS95_12420 [Pseudomonas fluorescens]|uniref:Uncharacterized protein n=1 Tax=Pseudomonas fluorescens TaxID=294 RepID=A0AAE2A7Q7_PSEFL|nr:hypothetical protein QS95_12420 [Pseudomonas fluorescens]
MSTGAELTHDQKVMIPAWSPHQFKSRVSFHKFQRWGGNGHSVEASSGFIPIHYRSVTLPYPCRIAKVCIDGHTPIHDLSSDDCTRSVLVLTLDSFLLCDTLMGKIDH